MIRRSSAIVLLGALIASASFAIPAHAVGEPTIARATTVDDGDGHLDAVKLTFSGAMETTAPSASWFAATPNDPGFHVVGYSIVSGSWPDSTTLRLNLSPLPIFDTAARPIVHYKPVTGGPRAAATGLALGATGASGITSADGAGPVIMAATANDLAPVHMFNAAGDELRITFTEPVTLAGVGPTRSANLENVIKFTSVLADGANGCTADGTALSNQNFPQQGTGAAPVAGDPATASDTIVARMSSGNTGSIKPFVGVPKGCALSIDASNNNVITDSSGNAARPFNAVAGKTIFARITPAPITLTKVTTTDGVDSTPDGVADGLAFTFSAPLSDDTIGRIADQVAVEIGGVPASSGAVDTGAAADDSIAHLEVTIPAGTAANAIAVAYTAGSCAHAPSGTTTDGIAGRVLYGPPFLACVSSFAADATDGVGPAVLEAVTVDVDTDGKIDAADVTFSEAVAIGEPAGWSLGEAEATAFTLGEDPTNARIAFTEGEVADGGALPMLSYAHDDEAPTLDAAENEVPTASWPTSDGVGPGVVSAVALDTDDDGNVDRVRATLSEDAKIPTGTEPAVTFGSATATQVTIADGDELVARFTGTLGSGTADLTVTSGVTDLGGRAMTATPFTEVAETIAPRGTITVSPAAPIKAGTATVRVDYTEAMADEALTATIDTATISPVADDQHTANGWRLDDPSIWEGTVTIAADACSVSAGCPVTITADGGHDLQTNAPLAAPSLDTLIDTMAPAASSVTAVAGTGATGAPANVVNNQARQLSAAVGVPAGEADGGTVEVLLDGVALTPPMRATIPAGASSVTAISGFDDPADLFAALGAQGEHEVTTRICDAALNCTDGDAFTFTVDTVVAEPAVEAPSSNVVLRGGASLPIRWTTDDTAEPVTVDVAWSSNGTSWTTIAADQPADGSRNWKLPALEVSGVRIRVTGVDANGNLGHTLAAGRVTIDSKAPVVKRFVVPTLSAGKKATLRWVVTDASISGVANPITLQESLDGGRTWRKINGGSYSKRNDGLEVLRVPAGRSSSYRLRLIATDGARRVTTYTTKNLTTR